jgi:BMFP domain-containing protein YqiC
MSLAPTPRNLIAASFLFLAIAAFFGVLNNFKIRGLHDALSGATAQQEAAEIRPIAPQKNFKVREVSAAEASWKISQAESKAAKAEADLAQARKEKADLQAKVDTTEAKMASLSKNIDEFGGKPVFEMPDVRTGAEADAPRDELRRSLESAEREKEFLSGKLRTMEERVGQLEDERKRRVAASAKPGLRGKILAVNHAYNFVVLDLAGRHGVELNTEMLVVRDGAVIGKIRISSVEPATSIGDIMTRSLARGVQFQPGDIVIYGGSSP